MRVIVLNKQFQSELFDQDGFQYYLERMCEKFAFYRSS